MQAGTSAMIDFEIESFTILSIVLFFRFGLFFKALALTGNMPRRVG